MELTDKAKEILNKIGKKSNIDIDQNGDINETLTKVFIGRKEYSYNKFVSYLQDELNIKIIDAIETATILLNAASQLKDDEDVSTEYVGDSVIIEKFLDIVEVCSSKKIILKKELPIDGHHLNTHFKDNFVKELGGAELDMNQMLYSFDHFVGWNHKNGIKLNVEYNNYESLEQYLRNKEKKETTEFFDSVRYDSTISTDYAGIIVKSILFDDEIKYANDYAALLKHWLWCIKRRALGLKTKYEIMLVFTGKQGTGKTTFCKRLMGKLRNAILEDATFKNIIEDRSAAIDAQKLVWIMDELPFADKSCLESIKTWITADSISYRKMGTNSSIQLPKKSMAIGSSNKPLSSLINDTTGNRRFVEFRAKQSKNEYFDIFKLDHELYEEFLEDGVAWTNLWKTIDETLVDGYYDMTTTGYKHIMNSGMTDSIECNFWRDCFSNGHNGVQIRRSVFHKMYESYCKVNGNKAKSEKQFVNDFESVAEELGFNYSTRNHSNVTIVNVPLIKIDYKKLFQSIPDTIPGVLDRTGNNIFHDDSKFNKYVEEDIATSTIDDFMNGNKYGLVD